MNLEARSTHAQICAWRATCVAIVLSLAASAGAQTASPSSDAANSQFFAQFVATGLEHVNAWRAMAKIPPIENDPTLGAAAFKHARYLVKNGIADGDMILKDRRITVKIPPDASRWEKPGKPYFSDEGAALAANAAVLSATKIDLSGPEFVDQLMALPFSGVLPMVPQLTRLGVGGYCEPGQCAIVLGVRYQLDKTTRIALYDGPSSDQLWNERLGPVPGEAGRLRTPVAFPPDGATVALGAYPGGDTPEALSSCADFKAPTGLPISIQFGQGLGPDGNVEISERSLSHNGAELDTCLITSATYRGPDQKQTDIGKAGLSNGGVAIILPRRPLEPGLYKVSVTENSIRRQWSFTVAPASKVAAVK